MTHSLHVFDALEPIFTPLNSVLCVEFTRYINIVRGVFTLWYVVLWVSLKKWERFSSALYSGHSLLHTRRKHAQTFTSVRLRQSMAVTLAAVHAVSSVTYVTFSGIVVFGFENYNIQRIKRNWQWRILLQTVTTE